MIWRVTVLVLLIVLSLENVHVQELSVADQNKAIEIIYSCKCVKHFLCGDDGYIITSGIPGIKRRLGEPIDKIECKGNTFPFENVCCRVRSDSESSTQSTTTVSTTQSTTVRSTQSTTKKSTTPLSVVTRNPEESNTLNIPSKDITCGIQKTIINTRIHNTDEDLTPIESEFPWIASIFKMTMAGKNKFICSGTLIHPNVVLTIGHCVNKKVPSDLLVIVNGKTKHSEQDATPDDKRDISDIVIHPNYNDRLLYYDAALLILETPFVVETWSSINTLCLPPNNFNLEDKTCLVAGWGEDNSNNRTKLLKKVEVPLVGHSQCQALLRNTKLGRYFKLHSSFTCAGGEKGRDACVGDGGSPLMCLVQVGGSQYFQAGIVSWGVDCGNENVPGVYTDVAEVAEWIKNELDNRHLTF